MKKYLSRPGFAAGTIITLFVVLILCAGAFKSEEKPESAGEEIAARVNHATLNFAELDRLVLSYHAFLPKMSENEKKRELIRIWIESQLLKQADSELGKNERIQFTGPTQEEMTKDGWAISKHDFETVKSAVAEKRQSYEEQVEKLKEKAEIRIHPNYR